MASKQPVKAKSKPDFADKFFFLKYPYLFLTLLVSVVYARTLGCGLTHFDDAIFVIDMKDYFNDWGNILTSFQRGVFESGMYYRPVLLIDFIVEHHIFNENPSGYHFTNVLFHIIAVLLFFHLLLKLKTGELTAFAMASVFAVHPVLGHAVIWIPGRNDILLCIFLLAAMLHFINWINQGQLKNLAGVLFFVLLALFTKETAWLIPVLFGGYAILFTNTKITDKKIVLPIVGLAFSFALYFLLKAQVETTETLIRSDFISLIISRVPIIYQYLGKIFFPVNLSVIPLVEDTSSIPGFIAIVAFTGIIISNKSYKNLNALFGLLWFALFLFPLLLILPPLTAKPLTFENPAYEHRLYLSLMGFLLFISSLVNMSEVGDRKIKLYIWAGIIVLFSGISISRISYFDEALSFFERAVKDAPHSATSKVALASRIYRDPLQRQRALGLFNEAYRLNPNERFLNFFLGLDNIENQNLGKAEKHLRKEIENTDFYEANFSLSDLLFRKGEYDSSVYYLRKLMNRNTKDDRVYNNLVILYIEKQDYMSAREVILKAEHLGVAVKQDMVYEVQRHLAQ